MHVSFSPAVPRGVEYAVNVKTLRRMLDYFQNQSPIMVQMLAGADPNVAASFTTVAAEYGVMGTDPTAQLAAAKTMFDEQNSMLGSGGDQAAAQQFLAICG